MKNPSILFIGAGRMAEAIIAGLHKTSRDQIEKVYVSNRSNPKRLQILAAKFGVITVQHWSEAIQDVDVIVLAMPPEQHETILEQLKNYVDNQFIVTIAAGIGPSFLEARLPSNSAVGWIMPNTAAEVGHSISLYTYGKAVTERHKTQMSLLVNSVGKAQLCTEQDIHNLTAVTGSAPAFLYLFVESLIDMTEKLGVTKETSQKLVTEMVIGSAEMLKAGKSPEDLREQVTTPGGATAEGLKILSNGGFQHLIQEAIVATNKKAKGNN
ncbi:MULTISPECIES: pyrroline-5-carboxylate reductase [Metabacillus]|uniref:Pyrroline-5-carboxylate reductase n=2 Tax=Metabacillus TaxID=2675233 RepID=A0A179SUU5_9BACI|nr:pyrroline-5-carboxylate reductase [Metabacillus litoralis]OAS85291.1 pyrroline-5-carboxylate reductase [Metabacillus litoralis]